MDLHITRASAWISSARTPVSLDEWRAAASGVPGMRLAPGITGETLGGSALEIPGEFAMWIGPGTTSEVVFSWVEGRIDVSVADGDDGGLVLVRKVARALAARLVDDGDIVIE